MIKNFKFDKNYLILFLFSLIFCLPIFLNSDAIFNGDIKSFWFVNNEFFSRNFFLYGEMPLWNPTIYGGMPSLGDPQSLLFSPLYALFFFLDFHLAVKISFFFYLLVSGVSMFFFLKTLSLKKEAGLFGAVAYMFSGRFMVTLISEHMNLWIVYALLPLLFAFSLLALEKKSFQYSLFTGLIISFMFLGGHPQFFAYSFLALCLFLLFKLIDSMKSFSVENFVSAAKKILVFFVPVLIVFLLISSVKIFPVFEFFFESSSTQGVSFEHANFNSLQPENFISMILPNFFGNPVNNTSWGQMYYHELLFFPGVIVLLLAVFAVFFNRDKLTKFFSLLLLFSFIFAFGSALFLFDIFRILPLFSSFRIPARMLFISSFCVPVIAALGLNKLMELKKLEKKQKLFFKTVLLFSFTALAVFVLSASILKEKLFELAEKMALQKYAAFSIERQEYFISRIPDAFNLILRDLFYFFIFTFGFFVLVFFFLEKNRLSKKHFSLFLVFLCFFELFSFGFIFIDLKNPVIEKDDAIDFIEEQQGYFRVFDYKLNWYPETANSKIQNVFAYNRAAHKKYNQFIGIINKHSIEEMLKMDLTRIDFGELTGESNTKILHLLNAKYIVSKEELFLDSMPLVFKSENYFVYENNSFLPRAFVVGNARVLDSDKKVYETISSDLFNPRKEVLLSKGQEIDSAQKFEQAEIEYYSPNKIVISASLEDKGYLVLLEKNYPGWKAFENGKELEIETANYIFRAVRLEKGFHKIEFVFLPESVFYGSLLSFLGVVFVIGFTGLNFFKLMKKTKQK